MISISTNFINVKVKLKGLNFTLERTLKAQRGVLFLQPRLWMGVGWSTPRPGRFTPGKETPYAFYRRLGGPHDRCGWMRKSTLPPGFDRRTIQPVASRYSDCAIPAHSHQLHRKPKLKFTQFFKSNVFHVRALYYTKTLIISKCTKRVLSSIVTHSYMFRPCWVIFRENFLLSLH
jgi:hypothetical protein